MNDLFDVSQQTILVTGASSGIGRHFAQTLAGAGANVVLAARRRDRLDKLCAQISQNGGRATAVELDVTDPDAIPAAFDAAESAFGTVNVVVNNAGIGRGSPLHETTDADWQATLDTNLTAVHRIASEAVRRLIGAGTAGSIVNIASILGLRVAAGTGAYNASKAAVIHLTKSQALEWARYGIRANAICPGYFPTEINEGFLESPRGQELLSRNPMRRAGQLHELSGVLLLLVSEASSYMTGSVIAVDGGQLCSSL